MDQTQRLQIFSLISLDPDAINKISGCSCDIIFPIEMSHSFLSHGQVSSPLILKSISLKRIIFIMERINSESRYKSSSRIESLSSLWKEKEISTIFVLDSLYINILTLKFLHDHSYIIRISPGSHDYNFEYIEFIFYKLMKSGFSLYGLGDLKETKDLIEYISNDREIIFLALSSRSILIQDFSAVKTLAYIVLKSINQSNKSSECLEP